MILSAKSIHAVNREPEQRVEPSEIPEQGPPLFNDFANEHPDEAMQFVTDAIESEGHSVSPFEGEEIRLYKLLPKGLRAKVDKAIEDWFDNNEATARLFEGAIRRES